MALSPDLLEILCCPEVRTPVKLAPEGGSFSVATRELPRRVALNEDRGLLVQLERAAPSAQR